MPADTTPTRFVAHNAPVGPGTPFPFRQEQGPLHHQSFKRPYPTIIEHGRRESLPPMRSVVSSPSSMAPPSRPVMGYQQHRLAQGHTPHDRSLTLPPLQTGRPPGDTPTSVATAGNGTALEDHVMIMPFRYKITVLGRIARPAVMNEENMRGPLIAVEGDDPLAVKELGHWLADELAKGTDLDVHFFDGPDVDVTANVDKPMVQYHQLVAEWLARSDEITHSIMRRSTVAATDLRIEEVLPNGEQAQSDGDIGAQLDDLGSSIKSPEAKISNSTSAHMHSDNSKPASSPLKPIVDNIQQPVGVIPNFSLHSSNVFARRIPIEANEAYTLSDHWSWTATQWRGVVGPDLTIYVRDSNGLDTGRPSVEMMEEGNLFLVKRVDGGKGFELEASTARRLAFEVSEWARAFGSTESESR